MSRFSVKWFWFGVVCNIVVLLLLDAGAQENQRYPEAYALIHKAMWLWSPVTMAGWGLFQIRSFVGYLNSEMALRAIVGGSLMILGGLAVGVAAGYLVPRYQARRRSREEGAATHAPCESGQTAAYSIIGAIVLGVLNVVGTFGLGLMALGALWDGEQGAGTRAGLKMIGYLWSPPATFLADIVTPESMNEVMSLMLPAVLLWACVFGFFGGRVVGNLRRKTQSQSSGHRGKRA